MSPAKLARKRRVRIVGVGAIGFSGGELQPEAGGDSYFVADARERVAVLAGLTVDVPMCRLEQERAARCLPAQARTEDGRVLNRERGLVVRIRRHFIVLV